MQESLSKDLSSNPETLPPFYLYNQLKSYQKQLSAVIEAKQQFLNSAPKGHIRTLTRGRKNKFYQFYLVNNRSNPNGTYLSRSQNDLVKKIFQRDYDSRLLPVLKAQLSALNQLLKTDSTEKNMFFFTNLTTVRQSIVTPVTFPDAIYAKSWLQKKFIPKQSHQDFKTHITSFGLEVRSKSETIIAEALHKNNIPFIYEYPLPNNSGTIYPDFFCLNLKNRRTFYWEHFGMMDDENYAFTAVKKINLFQNEGYFPGINLILTFETSKLPITSRSIEKIIENYLQN